MKIMILGGGIAAHRYVESLIWTDHEIYICGFDIKSQSRELSNKYNLPYIQFCDLSEIYVSNFDMIISCVSLTGKYKIVFRLIKDLKYKNSLIIEKPLSINTHELKNYYDLLSPLKSFAIPCQRDFAINDFKIHKSNIYNITWLSIMNDLYSNIVNMLPHLLSWLMLEIGDDINLEIVGNELYGSICNKELHIQFINSINNRVIINNVDYGSPNYRQINSKIVDNVSLFSKNESMKNLNRAIAVSKIIIRLLEGKLDE